MPRTYRVAGRKPGRPTKMARAAFGERLRTLMRSEVGVLVVNADLPGGRGLVLAKATHAINPKLGVIHASRMPQRVPEREKVTGAPCLRMPYHPHQFMGVIGLLTGRLASEGGAQVA